MSLRAFTLVELLVGLSISAMLAAVLSPLIRQSSLIYRQQSAYRLELQQRQQAIAKLERDLSRTTNASLPFADLANSGGSSLRLALPGGAGSAEYVMNGVPIRRVGDDFGVTWTAAEHHWQSYVPGSGWRAGAGMASTAALRLVNEAGQSILVLAIPTNEARTCAFDVSSLNCVVGRR